MLVEADAAVLVGQDVDVDDGADGSEVLRSRDHEGTAGLAAVAVRERGRQVLQALDLRDQIGGAVTAAARGGGGARVVGTAVGVCGEVAALRGT